ncbi:MAG: hypothetical protein OEY97_09235 [Nitrospirota bacterium]|nr:hypothetical protein [Nitrospirota bacterium]
MAELVHSLRRVCSHLDDVRGIALFGIDGLVVEEIRQDPLVDLSMLGAELSVSLKGTQESTTSAQLGTVQAMQIKMDNALVLVQTISAEYFLLLVLRAGGNPGRALFYLQNEAERLVSEF